MRLPLLAALLAAPCAAQSVLADDAVGCYRLEHAPWPDGLDHLPTPDGMPERLELTADPFRVRTPAGFAESDPDHWTERMRRVRFAGLADGSGPFEFWVIDEGRLVLNRHLPMGGFVIEVTRAGDDWEGTLTGGTDFIPENGHASESVAARLVREPCPPR